MSPTYTGALGGVDWLESRDDTRRVLANFDHFNRSGSGIFESETNRTISRQRFLNEVTWNTTRSIRTSTIVLASLNIIAAFATAVGILCDSYFRKRRNDRNFRFRRNGFTFVPEAEVYPLVLSVGIFIQSFIFAGAQSTGLDSLFGPGCTWLAELMLPAVFIVPYTQLVLGIDVAIRALRKQPFAPRGKYNVPVCLSIIGLLLLANFLVADFDHSPNFCLSSLFWFVSHYSIACFALFIAITGIILVCVVIICVRLHRSIKVEITARVAASRMVYYLALAVVSNAFLIPFFFVQGFMDGRGQLSNALTLGMIAAVVANVSGLMTGGLYLFLKSSPATTIGPRDKAGEYENRRAFYKMARYDSNDSDDNAGGSVGHMNDQVAGSRTLRRVDSEATLLSGENEAEASDSKSTNTVASKTSMVLLPATTYSPADALKPPPSMANLANMRHRRDSSLVSSATVQIGIRLSSVDDIPPLAQDRTAASDDVAHTLDCPNVVKPVGLENPKRPGPLDASAAISVPPPEPADATSKRDPVKDAKMKTLPPVPKIDSQVPKAEPLPQEEVTLSPSVYSPQTPTKVKLPSPKGVGFSMPVPKTTNGVPPRSPPRRRGTGDATPPSADAKGAWI
ncbi:69178988-744e-494f-972d-a3f828e632a0 [Thermothielavioides terrestris]|uniref:69178988-744e-494f-972d-a3f828e632a0 n=1 Tax=Thermothielavioides terrestris TaxID=2587410 RepID=A0A3S5CWR5_9PEZI|nr:69178988-744e-494f-972d-a3f828e632a0 [Thermothielavioides terrestris]